MMTAKRPSLPQGTTSGKAMVTIAAAAQADGGNKAACPDDLLEAAQSDVGALAARAVQRLDRIAHRRRTHARRLTVIRSANAFGSVEGSSTLTSFRSSEVMRI